MSTTEIVLSNRQSVIPTNNFVVSATLPNDGAGYPATTALRARSHEDFLEKLIAERTIFTTSDQQLGHQQHWRCYCQLLNYFGSGKNIRLVIRYSLLASSLDPTSPTGLKWKLVRQYVSTVGYTPKLEITPIRT